MLDTIWLRSFRRKLLAWYSHHARDLPWRQSRDPYRVWISEIMLQQTQVNTVRPYFKRFVERFPTVNALAAADEQEVLRHWEGLGYYRRARQMHAAAGQIVEIHGGHFPEVRDAVLDLPGVGRYTAGAILSIAFDAPEPILEANTIRLFCRLLAYEGLPTAKEGQTVLWSMAETVLPKKETGRFNQALMELGSEVCTNGTPRCESCPVAGLCRGRAEGLETSLPKKPPKKEFEHRHEAAVLIRKQGRVLLCQLGDEGCWGRWAGLWDFPRFEIQSEHEQNVRHELTRQVRQLTGLEIELGQRLKTIRHGVTRFKITLDGYEAQWVSGRPSRCDKTIKWLHPSQLDNYPLSTTGRKLSRLA